MSGVTIEEYSFWCWKNKLPGVLHLVYLLADRLFSDNAAILESVHSTNADKDVWIVDNISLVPRIWQVAVALDSDNPDIVFIRIKAPAEFQQRIRFLDQIQASLKSVDLDSEQHGLHQRP